MYTHSFVYTLGGADYEPNTVVGVFNVGNDMACIGVTIEDDDMPEPSLEFFSLFITSGDAAAVFTDSSDVVDVSIQNNDGELQYSALSYL